MQMRWPWQKKDTGYSPTDPVAVAATQAPSNVGKSKSNKAHWLWRLIKISPFGALRLAIYSTIVGFFLVIVDVQENPKEAVEANALTYVAHASKLAVQAFSWAVENFGNYALLGATIVIPIWLLWRLISLPFRR